MKISSGWRFLDREDHLTVDQQNMHKAFKEQLGPSQEGTTANLANRQRRTFIFP